MKMAKTSGAKTSRGQSARKRSEVITKSMAEYEIYKGLRSDDFKFSFQENLKYRLVKESNTATDYDKYLSLAYAIRDRLVENWLATQKTYRDKKVTRDYYFSLEFLIGRPLGNSIINLQV